MIFTEILNIQVRLPTPGDHRTGSIPISGRGIKQSVGKCLRGTKLTPTSSRTSKSPTGARTRWTWARSRARVLPGPADWSWASGLRSVWRPWVLRRSPASGPPLGVALPPGHSSEISHEGLARPGLACKSIIYIYFIIINQSSVYSDIYQIIFLKYTNYLYRTSHLTWFIVKTLLFIQEKLFRYLYIGDISFYRDSFCYLVFHPPLSILLLRSDDIFFQYIFLALWFSREQGRTFQHSSTLSFIPGNLLVCLLSSPISWSFLGPEKSLDLFLLQQLFGWFPPLSWRWHVWCLMFGWLECYHWLCLV